MLFRRTRPKATQAETRTHESTEERLGNGGHPGTLLVAGLAAVLCGYCAGLRSSGETRILQPAEIPLIQSSMTWHSFSELDRARSQVSELCRVAITELQWRTLNGAFETRDPTKVHEKSPRDHARLIAAFAELRNEVQNSPEEEAVLRQLLRVLGDAGDWNRWLDSYVDFICRHPWSVLRQDLEGLASSAAWRCGRQEELATVGELATKLMGHSIRLGAEPIRE